MNNRLRTPRALALAAVLLCGGLPLGSVQAQAPPPLIPPPPPPPSPDNTPALAGGGDPNVAAPVAPPALPPVPVPGPNTPPPAAGGVTLRYKYTPGQTIHYKLTVDVNGTITDPNGTGIPMKQHVDVTLHQTVQSVRASDGAATLATQIDSLAFTMNGRNIPLPPQAQQQFKQPYTSVMTPTGKIVSFQSPTGATLPGTGFGMSDIQNLRALPDQAVGVNDDWLSTYASAALGLTARTRYTLTKISDDGGTATIGQKIYGEFKPPTAAPTAATTPMPKMNMSGLLTGTGTETFDITAGQIAGQINDLSMKMTMTPPGVGHAMKTDFHITTDMERVPDGTATTTPAPPAPTGEPPTGQLQ